MCAAVARLIYGEVHCGLIQLRNSLSDLKAALAAYLDTTSTTRNSAIIFDVSTSETRMYHSNEEIEVKQKMEHNGTKYTGVHASGFNRVPKGSSAEKRKARSVKRI